MTPFLEFLGCGKKNILLILFHLLRHFFNKDLKNIISTIIKSLIYFTFFLRNEDLNSNI